MNGIIGRKLGMARVFDEEGRVTPVTVIEAGPCPVVQVRTLKDGRHSAQIGFGTKKAKRTSKALAGHAKVAGLESTPAMLREFAVPADAESVPNAGDVVTVEIFAEGETVKVTAKTKGHGFQGVVKRYGFRGGPASHGSTRYRRPGSMGAGTDPSRVIKGKKLPGQYGATQHTETGLRVVKIDAERNLLFVRGAVPGPMRGLVTVRKQGGRGRYA
jgi:large subunit ribosomal protein L3